MTRKTLYIYLGIGLLLAALTCLSYTNTRKQMLEVAERTFVEAVHQDLDKRWKNSGETFSYTSGKEKPQYTQITIESEEKKESYSIKDLDYTRNVDHDFYRRMLHSLAAGLKQKYNPDSLEHIWQLLLSESGLEILPRAIVTNSRKYIPMPNDSTWIRTSLQPLPVYYAGAMNEIQLNAFVGISIMDVLNFQPTLWIYISLCVFCMVLFIWKMIQTHSAGKTPNQLTTKSYRLSADVVYYPFSRCFVKGEEKISLQPKSNLIVKALLEAENHQLHGMDLLAKVWNPNETNMNKLYIQNTKLRTVLKNLGDGFDIISISRSHFRLLFPYSQAMQDIDNKQCKDWKGN